VGAGVFACSSSNGNGAASDASAASDATPAADGGSMGPSDAHVVDAKRRGPYDSAASADDSGAVCPMPSDVSKWPVPEYRHAKHQPTACSAQAISDFDAACLASTSSMAACSTYQTANTTCYACLVSQVTDATWGPVYLANNVYQANIGGCIELADPANATCAQVQETASLCEHAACDSQCPVSSQASFTAYQECTAAADQEGCSQYVTQASNCLVAEDAGAAAVCAPTTTSFDAFFLAIAPLFCSGSTDGGTSEAGGPIEAGTDSAGDGPAE
jgi:hypothetical protein